MFFITHVQDLEENVYKLATTSIRMLNEDKFDRLYIEHYPSMLAYARNFVLPEDAEEAVQDVMVWLWENRKSLEIKTTLKGYLFRSVRNSCMNRITQAQAQQRLRQAIFDRIQPFYEDTDNYTSKALVKKLRKRSTVCPKTIALLLKKVVLKKKPILKLPMNWAYRSKQSSIVSVRR